MSNTALDAKEQAWVVKVVALLEQDKKMQWTIGETLLEGEHWFAPGIAGKDLHEMDEQLNRNQKGAEEENTPYRVSIGGHDPYKEVSKQSGYDRSTLQDFMRVARVFPAGKRVGELSWSHHQACAAKWLTDKQRADILEEAERLKLSLSAVRKKVNELNGNEIDHAKGLKHVSLQLSQSKYSQLERIAKKEKRTVVGIVEQLIDKLLKDKLSKAA